MGLLNLYLSGKTLHNFPCYDTYIKINRKEIGAVN